MSIEVTIAPSIMPNQSRDGPLQVHLLPSTKQSSLACGLPGCGKTFLLNQLKQELGQKHFAFYEGSKMIAVASGGLDAFQKLAEQEKVQWRQRAIDAIRKESTDNGQTAIVTGHFIFWPEEQEDGQPVCTQTDMEAFTHILCLDTPAKNIARLRQDDT